MLTKFHQNSSNCNKMLIFTVTNYQINYSCKVFFFHHSKGEHRGWPVGRLALTLNPWLVVNPARGPSSLTESSPVSVDCHTQIRGLPPSSSPQLLSPVNRLPDPISMFVACRRPSSSTQPSPVSGMPDSKSVACRRPSSSTQ
jgi:hypothetical protein